MQPSVARNALAIDLERCRATVSRFCGHLHRVRSGGSNVEVETESDLAIDNRRLYDFAMSAPHYDAVIRRLHLSTHHTKREIVSEPCDAHATERLIKPLWNRASSTLVASPG